MSLLSRLRVLLSLPLVVSELLIQVSELNSRLREQNQLQRELIQLLSNRPAETPIIPPIFDQPPVIGEIGDLSASMLRPAAPSTPRDPRRLRTDRDVHYTSQPLPRG